MKTIKFRIYDKQQNKMIESGATPMMLKSFFEHTAVLHTRDEMPYQQFTGLLDKNGKEIYEGDILKINTGDGEFNNMVCSVVFKNGAFRDSYYCWNLYNKTDCYEIIGNIYENPDLVHDVNRKNMEG